ncbi:MAG: DEAD/DEAH box helicase, partial [Candidatus Aenigmarchaeota archaeon]|nr:DEAD/DEAH box helicase [Candidatus Aenigmarchaeota archaeon]
MPVYPETEGLSSRWLRYKIQPLLKYIYNIKDYLPEKIKRNQDLVGLEAAVRTVHFPENTFELKKAKKRIAFDELFLLQLKVLIKKLEYQKEKAPSIKFQEGLSKKFVQSLPFRLTEAQRKSSWEIIQDIGKDTPMNRLLEGDVGSGKTVVSCFAMFLVAKSGFQSAFMCPTEILAKQHYQRITKILKPFGIKISLLVGGLKKKDKEGILEKIKQKEAQVVIGTHALIQEGVQFKNLALCVIDEQHRFGVEQRKRLKEISGDKKTSPHFLSMTATPIPRTLTLTMYGDLDVSILDEMPPGRQPVVTKLAPKDKREAAYDFIRRKVKKGQQVFVICPLI